MTRSALVTGAAGFVGRRLVRALDAAGWRVTGTAQHAEPNPGDPVAAWITGDVRDVDHLRHAVDAAAPDAVFHLAGVSFVPAAAADPGYAAEVNAVAAARLVGTIAERRRAGALDPAVVVVGSGEQYGRHDPAEFPLPETAELRPHTVYAATKAAQETLALQAFRSDGVRTVAARSFNHSGPGQHFRFLLPGLVGRARALREGPPGAPLVMGNQTTVRDFLHVDDVVAAYIALAERGRPGEAYNVASGVGHSVGDLARRVLARSGVSAPVESDPALVRPAEVPALVGSAAKLARDTGWAPRRTLDDLLDDLIAAA
ncbi:GDP-mannose 4,6-dehydratase [Gemmatimonadetes bacterium T265]|nr:GDP-mannose 4,6-dehydratase [Gemmatimonadetes bacterium T265]